MWRQFDHDPRSPSNAQLRASDRDRAVIETVLADAFAEGRITRTEYDERARSRPHQPNPRRPGPTRGADLPVSATRPGDAAATSTSRRCASGQADRREALVGLIGLSALVWTIWAVTMWGGFPWPLFPMGFALMNLVRIVVNKRDIIEEHTRKLEKKERKDGGA